MIFLISPFVNPYEHNSNRVEKLYRLLKKKELKSIIITTNFDHSTKQKYQSVDNLDHIIHLKVPEYQKNISLKRFWSHTVFAWRLWTFLRQTSYKIDALYCTVPTLLSAMVCIIYARKRNIRCAVDIIDLWPNSLIALLPFKKIFQIILSPWYLFAANVYRSAPKLFAASKQYADYTQHFRKSKVEYVNLGIDTSLVSYYKQLSAAPFEKKSDKVYIAYGGSLGKSYDFEVILDALAVLQSKGIKNFYFYFVGDGEEKENIRQKIEKYNLPATITGKVNYALYLSYLGNCDIGINSFKHHTEVVYSYKFNDYVSVGLAVLNNLKGETSAIIDQFGLGYNFDYESKTLASYLEKLLTDDGKKLNTFKENAHHYTDTIGSYEIGYMPIIKYLEGNSDEGNS